MKTSTRSTATTSNLAPGIVSVDSATRVHVSIPVLASATAGSLTSGRQAVVSERNPNVARAADVSVSPGVHSVYDAIDLSAPSYAAARGLVGFQDSPSSAKSPLC